MSPTVDDLPETGLPLRLQVWDPRLWAFSSPHCGGPSCAPAGPCADPAGSAPPRLVAATHTDVHRYAADSWYCSDSQLESSCPTAWNPANVALHFQLPILWMPATQAAVSLDGSYSERGGSCSPTSPGEAAGMASTVNRRRTAVGHQLPELLRAKPGQCDCQELMTRRSSLMPKR